MSRSLLSGGPAYLVFNGLTVQMHEDWTVDNKPESFPVSTNLQGPVAEAIKDTMAVIKFKPIAFGSDILNQLTKLFPYDPSMVGQVIFPQTDLPVQIYTKRGGTGDTGQLITFKAGAITKMPDVTFTADKAFFGEVELTVLKAGSTPSQNPQSFLSIADFAYVEPVLDPADILYDAYQLVYGASPSAPFDNIEVDEAGITFAPKVSVTPRISSRSGTYNFTISSVECDLKFNPQNISVQDFYANLLKMQGTGYTRGALRNNLGDQLTIQGSGPGKVKLFLPLAAADAGTVDFSLTKPGESAVNLKALRKIDRTGSAPVLSRLFTFSLISGSSPAVLSVDTTALTLHGYTSQATGNQQGSIGIANIGGGTLTTTIASNQSWLTPSTGSLTGDGIVTLALDASGFSTTGTQTATVTLTPSAGSPQTVTVTAIITVPVASGGGSGGNITAYHGSITGAPAGSGDPYPSSAITALTSATQNGNAATVTFSVAASSLSGGGTGQRFVYAFPASAGALADAVTGGFHVFNAFDQYTMSIGGVPHLVYVTSANQTLPVSPSTVSYIFS